MTGSFTAAEARSAGMSCGNQLLELLVQLAVVDARSRHGQVAFYTKPITITDFVRWLRNHYGILIDTTQIPNDSPESPGHSKRTTRRSRIDCANSGLHGSLRRFNLAGHSARFPISAELV